MTEATTVRLRTGAEMPVLGLGTWQLTGDDAREGVPHALELGYRLIDTADDYHNQAEIGEALRASPVSREDVFLTSKVEEDEDAYEATKERLRDLGEDYLDLCLIHRPPPSGAGEELWEGLLRAKADGLAREVGVSNYTPEQIDRASDATGEVPVVNQIEWSPFGHSREVLEHARERGVVIQAYSPLTRGKRLGDATLAEVGAAHDKTPAQVMLRWAIQLGTPPVPKAATPAHREENLAEFDFELSDVEVERLTALNERYSSLGGLAYV
ncbi:MAG TPA: aldo/keto reductase [Solirubrobacterales bacterium]|nr:aldo/keto reductase [Solirubrobacterales bacterium]